MRLILPRPLLMSIKLIRNESATQISLCTLGPTATQHYKQTLPLLPRPWVGFVIHLGEVLEIEVGVDLSGGDIGVAKQFLYGAQVVAGFEHVAGEGVA